MRRDVFQAIADPIRREIIDILSQEGESNLHNLISHFQVSRPAIAKHVRILKECGLVVIEKQGREQRCRPQLEKLGELALWVHQYRRFWNTRLDRLETLLKQENDFDKKNK